MGKFGTAERGPLKQPRKMSLPRLWRWLTRPLHSVPSASGRRARLLAWMLAFIFLLTLVSLVVVLLADPAASPRRGEYIGLIASLDVLVALAYGLNCADRYRLAAGVTLLCAVAGPWGSLLVDPAILRGDFVPLVYVSVSILLSSILLPPLFTIVLAGIQMIALAMIPLVVPAALSINWPSLLTFVFIVSVLCVLSGLVTKNDISDIEDRTHQLELSHVRLREISVRDHLTGLFNRRFLEETLEREIQRAFRSGQQIGIILVDVDHFKEVNDLRGHPAGDFVLQQIAQLITANIRAGDIACRYGGDEFVLVLPEASRQVAGERAERLRNLAKSLQLEYKGQPLNQVTLSAGVAVPSETNPTADLLLKSADNALYRAKNLGRDRIVLAE